MVLSRCEQVNWAVTFTVRGVRKSRTSGLQFLGGNESERLSRKYDLQMVFASVWEG